MPWPRSRASRLLATAAAGTAAILAGFLAVVASSDHIVADCNVYGGTHAILTEDLPRLGVAATLADAGGLAAIAASLSSDQPFRWKDAFARPLAKEAEDAALSKERHEDPWLEPWG
jgi:O-acetylhomoserine/O-acetylserine sulfhydrylase-like pyridoxal-dependent enzyme